MTDLICLIAIPMGLAWAFLHKRMEKRKKF